MNDSSKEPMSQERFNEKMSALDTENPVPLQRLLETNKFMCSMPPLSRRRANLLGQYPQHLLQSDVFSAKTELLQRVIVRSSPAENSGERLSPTAYFDPPVAPGQVITSEQIGDYLLFSVFAAPVIQESLNIGARPIEILTDAAHDVLAERRRQIDEEGMTTSRDDAYKAAELPRAAAAYIVSVGGDGSPPYLWPWPATWWKPRRPRDNFVRAAALLIAEIERIDRAAGGAQ